MAAAAAAAAAATTKPHPPISTTLPPLILGTATFNFQYVSDPARMPYTAIVRRALELGINAFDTSPYYGPSEELVGKALQNILHSSTWKRADYLLLTKAGRIAAEDFDYRPHAIRASVYRSLKRLGTTYLDLVYCHDVEFVAAGDVLEAVRELRRLRDEDKVVKYVGISGYPVDTLCELSEMILRETGEGLDAVMSYCHCTLQSQNLARGYLPEEQEEGEVPTNTTTTTNPSRSGHQLLPPPPVDRFRNAGVSAVLNASMLGMGLLTTRGVDHGPQAAWHPSPRELRQACARVAEAVGSEHGERLERVAIRYSIDTWARAGAKGAVGVPLPGQPLSSGSAGGGLLGRSDGQQVQTVGASVMGVSSVEELEETWEVWQSVLAEMDPHAISDSSSAAGETKVTALRKRDAVLDVVRTTVWPILGEWRGYSWKSGR